MPSVYNASGGADSLLALTWSVGETVSSDFYPSSIALTQGLLQPDTLQGTDIETIGISRIVINIYPNPATDKLFIDAPGKGVEVQISDLTGRVCIHQLYTSYININPLPSGMYVIQWRSYKAKSIFMSKFIKI
jgi:hypothetical protein